MICSFFVSAALKPSMKGGMEGRGMGAVVYLISIVGNIPRDLHFHLITATTELMTAAQWNRFLLPCQIFKKKKKRLPRAPNILALMILLVRIMSLCLMAVSTCKGI